MVNSEAIKCAQVWPEISNYVDGEIDGALHSAMDDHFRTCPRCASLLEGTRNVLALYGDERMLEVPLGFGQRLEKNLVRNLNGGRERGRWSPWSAWLVPIAALALVAGGVRLASSLTPNDPVRSALARPGQGIPPDLVVLVAAGTKVFHVAGCGVIHNKNEVRSITAREAIADGYVPCLRCMRKYLDVSAMPKPEALRTLYADVHDEDEEDKSQTR
jgi:hypothetical protein